jgi:hypothetical protein
MRHQSVSKHNLSAEGLRIRAKWRRAVKRNDETAHAAYPTEVLQGTLITLLYLKRRRLRACTIYIFRKNNSPDSLPWVYKILNSSIHFNHHVDPW